MKYALTGAMSKAVDEYTIHSMGVPSVVLMERAALEVAGCVARIAAEFGRSVRICAVCGHGNNGADGVAAARILTWQGLTVDIITVGNEEHMTEEFRLQLEIARKSHIPCGNISDIGEYDIIVDAIFGTGLSRDVKEPYNEVIEMINDAGGLVVSVDIPSGINADTGAVMNCAVRADATVTFGYNKIGIMLYPGKEYAGDITVADIGFCPQALSGLNPARYFTPEDIYKIPERDAHSNKGTYGRTVVIAGNARMSGAAYLAAEASYRSGSGLVEIVTHNNNTAVLKELIPEAIVDGYDNNDAVDVVKNAADRASRIIIGPGLGTDETARNIVYKVIDSAECPLIMDADALNIIADDISLLKKCKSTVIITPHIGEMERLCHIPKDDILRDIAGFAARFAAENNVICVLKDAATVVASPDGGLYINTSGCAAMSKGGMGDVLTGVISGMLACRLEPFSAAAMGVYIHGLAGCAASEGKSLHSVKAGDLFEYIGTVMCK